MNTLEKYRETLEDKEFHNKKPKLIPFLFNTDMVIAIQKETKTETRRTLKSKLLNNFSFIKLAGKNSAGEFTFTGINNTTNIKETFTIKPKAKKGDVIWVRETWQITDFLHPSDDNYGYIYKASENGQDWQDNTENWKWKPSIFMPKEACRIFLEIVDVHIEYLQDITEASAKKEGVLQFGINSFEDYIDRHMNLNNAKSSFKTLWQKINGPESWNANPYVIVYKFKKIDKPFNF